MADRDECALVTRQPVFQPVDGGKVEVVGRFIEQQQIGLAGERPAQRCPPPLAARGAGGIARQINAELVGDGLHFVARRGVRFVPGKVQQRGIAGEERILFQHHHFGAGLDRALAPVRLDLPCDQPQQRGLAGTIAADQRQPVTRGDVKIEVLEQPARALDQAKVFPGEDRCGGHGGCP